MPKQRFGKKLGSAKAVKDSLKGGGMGPLTFIPKEGSSLTVRFLEEPEEWVNYVEAYDPAIKRGYPYPDDPAMPGYDDELRKSSRYVANAVDVERDKVVALQLPKTIVNKMINRYEKNGTVIDRDYELFRSGSGLDTEYDAQPEAPSKKRLSKYEPLDLLDALEEAYESVWGTSDDDDDDDDEEIKRPHRRRKRVEVEDDDDDIEDDDDEEEDEDDDIDDDDGDDDEEDDEEDDDDALEWYEEEDLEGLPIGKLRSIMKEYGVTPIKGMKKPEVIEAILEAQEEAF